VIKNKTKNTIISKDFKLLKGYLNKSKGLISSNSPKTVIFTTRLGIHTFGMKYPIDIVVTDKESRVVSLKKNLLPNRIFLWNPKYNLIIELEIGSIAKSKTAIGDFLEISL
jgi:uncharacterized membrane protein (UPF0127 family)